METLPERRTRLRSSGTIRCAALSLSGIDRLPPLSAASSFAPVWLCCCAPDRDHLTAFCACVYIYRHMCTYLLVYTYTHVYVYLYECVYVHTRRCTHTHTHTCKHAHTHLHPYMCVYICVCVYMCAYILIYFNMFIYICT
jgi:hypothetical protein